ncbi:MAG TPA: M1 family metallopeptidase [Acidimicrobiales bacterium]|nr:M1 family metallopeptidase [Acidimicrobiales bacterium]
MPETPSYRLPRSVVPERYDLEISPDLGTARFAGRESVTLDVLEPVTEVVLNAAELEIASAVLVGGDGSELPATVELDAEEERIVVRPERDLEPGKWRLDIEFSGTINDKLRGLYRSTFRDTDDREHVIATTQFEATDARRAFPCWDEPDRKAVFSVTLVVDEGLAAFSNTAEIGRERREGKVVVRFADTMRMSTYLVAFVVGPLEATAPVDVGGVPLRVVHAPGKGEMTEFALEIGAHALRWFADWFGIPYPGDKLDLIALPDFAFGAMENLGAVTFRESLLLVDPQIASQVELERVADVVSHEIAHMWFGDLVTMRWWNGLWLNEAFATFMEMLCVDAFRPDWDRWVTFGLTRGAALATDGLRSTRPIEFPVARPEEAEGMFDVLTYQKGAGVLRMLERFLGADAFREGIRRYLRAHLYDNAETTDLWDAIEEATGEPVRATMDSWIFQEGHPLVTVEPTGSGISLSQGRFAYSGASGASTRWSIPVLLRVGSGGTVSEHRVLLHDRSSEVALDATPDWVVANAGGSGFYRVGYAPALAEALRADLGRLDALELFGLVSDSWAAALSGAGDVASLARLVRLLGGDEDPATWTVAVGALDLLERISDGTGRDAVAGYVRAVVGPAFLRLGWSAGPGEPDKVGTLRATLAGALGTTGADPEVRARAAELHEKVLSDRTAVDPDMVGAIVSVIAYWGGPAEYEVFLDRFRNPATPQDEVRYLYALGAFRDEALVRRTLDMALDEVRTQNAAFLISILLANRVGGPLAWRFVVENWDRLVERLPQNSIVRSLEGLTTLCTSEQAAEIHAFFDAHPIRSGQRTLDQILERLDVNVAFANRERGRVVESLAP